MWKFVVAVPSALLAGALVFAALWAWQGAGDFVSGWDVARPEVVVWAVKCGAVAAVAAAQVILLALVGARLYGRGPVDSALAFTAGAVCVMACVSAAAFGLAGR